MMQLKLKRILQIENATIGLLFLDNKFKYFTLERNDVIVNAGTYAIEIQWSPKFQQNMPRLQNVLGRSAIEIHWGNWPKNTDGCILIGMQYKVNEAFIGFSKDAFEGLFSEIEHEEELSIEISNDF